MPTKDGSVPKQLPAHAPIYSPTRTILEPGFRVEPDEMIAVEDDGVYVVRRYDRALALAALSRYPDRLVTLAPVDPASGRPLPESRPGLHLM
jgi:hypothetical protein